MSEEVWQTYVQFANVSVRNFGGASGDLTLKPLTLLYGPPESGVSHVASLLHAVVLHGDSISVFDEMAEFTGFDDDRDVPIRNPDLDEAYRVMERRRQKVKFTDSKYLAASARRHLHMLATGLEASLLGPDSPLQPDAAGFSIILSANRAHGRLEYSDDGLEEFPDHPNLRINFVMHGTARKGDKKHVDRSGPYLIREPYYYAGPRPYESGRDIHIDSYRGGGDVYILRNVVNAALHYYCERVSQPKWSVLVSDGGLTEYEPPELENVLDMVLGMFGPGRRYPEITGDTPAEKLQSALDKAKRGTMIVVENPEKYVDDMDSFIRTLFARANNGLFMLVVTGDQTLADKVAEMRQKSVDLDPNCISVYGFEPENGGHAIIEW